MDSKTTGVMKTFILTVSKRFMKDHPRAGEPTHFKEKILSGEKIHTIRGNQKLWEGIAKQVNEQRAILSLREWNDTPYRSKQDEFMRLERIGFQPIELDACGVMSIDGFYVDETFDEPKLAANDGLTQEDFQYWFHLDKDPVPEFKGGIIHFTDFRY